MHFLKKIIPCPLLGTGHGSRALYVFRWRIVDVLTMVDELSGYDMEKQYVVGAIDHRCKIIFSIVPSQLPHTLPVVVNSCCSCRPRSSVTHSWAWSDYSPLNIRVSTGWEILVSLKKRLSIVTSHNHRVFLWGKKTISIICMETL